MFDRDPGAPDPEAAGDGGSSLPVHELAADEILTELIALERDRARLDGRVTQLLGRFDADSLYELDGAATAKSWLKHQTHITSSTAAGRLKMARQLRQLPAFSDALAAGTVTIDQLRILLRGYRPSTAPEFTADQDTLLDAARTVHIDDLPRVITVWVAHIDPDGNEPDDTLDQELHLHQVGDGPFALNGQLAARHGHTLEQALTAAMADLRPSQDADSEPMTPSARRAEALIELARHYLDCELPDPTDDDTDDDTDQEHPNSTPDKQHRQRGRGLRITVLTNPTDLALGLGARTTTGTWLSGDDVRQLLCDATLQAALTDATGNLLRTYATGRFPTATLRASIFARDKHCRFHGCDRPVSACDIHHIIRSTDGGATEGRNLAPFCSRHHTLLHHGWTAHRIDDHGNIEIRRPDGTLLPQRRRWGDQPPDTS